MNEFQENTWTEAQRALDGAIAVEVEALGGSRFVHEQAGGDIKTWQAETAEQVAALRKQIAKITHTARRAYWDEQLAAHGFVPPQPEPTPTEAAAEPITTPTAPRVTEAKGRSR